MVGGLLGLLVSGHSLSFTAVIGFIAPIGIEIKARSCLSTSRTSCAARRGTARGGGARGRIRFLPVLLHFADRNRRIDTARHAGLRPLIRRSPCVITAVLFPRPCCRGSSHLPCTTCWRRAKRMKEYRARCPRASRRRRATDPPAAKVTADSLIRRGQRERAAPLPRAALSISSRVSGD